MATAMKGPGAFATDDVDRARAQMNLVYYPLTINPLTSEPFALRMKSVELDGLTLGRLTYASDVVKDCGELATAFHVNVPLEGEVHSRCDDQAVIASPRLAAVFNPDGHTILDRWRAGSTQLCLKIDRAQIEDEIARWLAHPLRHSVRFDLGFDLTTPAGQSWQHALHILASELNAPGGLATNPLLAAELRHLIVAGLLWNQPHSYSEELRTPAPALRPRHVKLAMQVIEESLDRGWSVGEIAATVGVGVRSLEDGFRRHLDMSPVAYLRERRLDKVHDDLAKSSPAATTVADVAYRWGFSHLGRFAAAYRGRFGENPSATLRADVSAQG
jgi:AraC-like DNA-binding protein